MNVFTLYDLSVDFIANCNEMEITNPKQQYQCFGMDFLLHVDIKYDVTGLYRSNLLFRDTDIYYNRLSIMHF